MNEDLANNETLRKKVADILSKLDKEGKKSLNATDCDCVKIHSRQGSHAGYNAQTVVDEKHGLIANADVVNENNDLHQFAEQIEQANETRGRNCRTACAEAGYNCVDELEKIDKQNIKVVVPSPKQISSTESSPFDKCNFKYDRDSDSYTCPQGHVLKYSSTNYQKRHKVYRIGSSICSQCCHFGVCSNNPRGRTVTRILKEELAEKLAVQYEQPESQKIYNLRKQKVELPFGHIKHNLKVGGFLLRGLAGAKAEMSILSSCFNVARMISIIGVCGLIARLAK
jgi:hypothetical protein